MAKRRTAQKSSSEPVEEARPPRRKRRFLRRLMLLGILLVGLVGLLPMIVSKSPLRNTLLNWQMPVGGWRIDSSDATLSWWGSQSLADVSIFDPVGQPLVKLESLTLDRSLLALSIPSNHLGKIKLVRPVVFVATSSEGSNVEKFLAAVREQQASSEAISTEGDSKQRGVDLEIVEGSVLAVDAANGEPWSIEQINLTTQLVNSTDRISADGTAIIPASASTAGGRLKFRVMPGENGQQQFDLLGEGLPLASLATWLSRSIGECSVAGTASIDAHATWSLASDGQRSLSTWGRAESKDASFRGHVTQGDEVRSRELAIPWKLSVDDGELTVEELRIVADWAELEGRGSVSLAELEEIKLGKLPKREFAISGKASLAPLAQMLRATLRIRPGVRIDSGEIKFVAKSNHQDGKLRWTADGTLANLTGQDGGRAIKWEEPVKVAAQWVDATTGPRLDRLTLAAPFASGDFTTSADRVQGEFALDLSRLSRELGQFVDMRGLDCRGSASGNLRFTASEGDAFGAEAEVAVRELVVSKNNVPLWQDNQLNLKLQAVGSANQLKPQSLSTGSLEMRGVRDSLVAKLVAPVDLVNRGPWSVQVEGAGPLESWAGRLRPWWGGFPTELSGDAAFKANVTAGPAEVQISGLEGSVNQLHVRKDSIAIDEPHVNFSGECQWQAGERRIGSKEFQLASSVAAFRSRDLRLEFPERRVPLMTGEVAYRTDLERLCGALGLIRGNGSAWGRGSAKGALRFATNSEQIVADFVGDGEQLQLVKAGTAGPPTVVWAEPKLHSAGKAIYNIADERATIEGLTVEGQTIQVVSHVVWEKPLAGGPVSVRGDLHYDPAMLAGIVAGFAGPEFQVQGDRVVRFEAQGTPSSLTAAHWSRAWQAKAEAGWTTASVFGLPIGEGKLRSWLSDGQVRIEPLDLVVGTGKLTLNPIIFLDPMPQRVVIPAGPVVSNVQISPAVSEQMLKYVAPVLAGATRVDGQFSLALAETQVPLADPKLTRTAGQLAVHQLTVLPGPLLADLFRVVEQVESLKDPRNLLGAASQSKPKKLLSMNDQQIDFQVVDGRVYHRQIEFIIDNVPIRSQGSVGFDQTLALMIEIPIQDRWIDGEESLRGLAGQKLQIPIQGTFQNPRVDQRAVADITRQLIRNSAGQAIGSEINRQLEKLFQGK